MLVVIPLGACIARPNQPVGDLIRHSETVARGCGNSIGTPEERLAFLAGLCHDLAKCSADWQSYIRSKCHGYTGRRIDRGPPHAPLGAALFAFWAESLIPIWEPSVAMRARVFDLALDWVRMIYRHHGKLDDLSPDLPWAALNEIDTVGLLATCDRAGLVVLLEGNLPEYPGQLTGFETWWESDAG
ncbi:MAG: CRISPR-associated endonuclease Cas3'' [Gemmataceae bacterium]